MAGMFDGVFQRIAEAVARTTQPQQSGQSSGQGGVSSAPPMLRPSQPAPTHDEINHSRQMFDQRTLSTDSSQEDDPRTAILRLLGVLPKVETGFYTPMQTQRYNNFFNWPEQRSNFQADLSQYLQERRPASSRVTGFEIPPSYDA